MWTKKVALLTFSASKVCVIPGEVLKSPPEAISSYIYSNNGDGQEGSFTCPPNVVMGGIGQCTTAFYLTGDLSAKISFYSPAAGNIELLTQQVASMIKTTKTSFQNLIVSNYQW